MAPTYDVAFERSVSSTVGSQIASLIERATVVDSVSPVSEDGRIRLRSHPASDSRCTHVFAYLRDGEPSTLAGYAQVYENDDRTFSCELVVDPASRRVGVGSSLVDACISRFGRSSVGFWAHGDQPDAKRIARSKGLRAVRELHQMRRLLDADTVAVSESPNGVNVRTFKPGDDNAEWLSLNSLAFRNHPEQGRWTEDDLAARFAEGWFDENGFFVAERDGQMVGYHWTKVESDNYGRSEGEVYVVGVHPTEQGTGLGTHLTAVGLRHLQTLGLKTAVLYVEGDNLPALKVYRRLGFTSYLVDVVYR